MSTPFQPGSDDDDDDDEDGVMIQKSSLNQPKIKYSIVHVPIFIASWYFCVCQKSYG